MRVLYLIFLLLMVLLVVGFAMLNAASVSVNYFFGQAMLPLAVSLFFALCIGAIGTFILMSGPLLRAIIRSRHLQNKIKRAEEQLLVLQESASRDSL